MITFTTGQVVTAAQMNATNRDLGNFILAPPLARMRQTVAGSVATSTWTSYALDTEDIDRDNGHSTVTNTSRYTAQTAGWYTSKGKVSYASNATNRRWARWAVNAAELAASRVSMQAVNGDLSELAAPAADIFLNLGDFVEIQGFQDSGGALNSSVATVGDQSFMSVRWVSS